MVEKLFVVCNDAREVWEAIQRQSYGFFSQVLQEEYSIGDEFSQKIIADFN